MENIELLYFVYPTCEGNCRHCWSHDLMLGRQKPLDWHYKMISRLADFATYSVIKLSGGEPFLNRDLGKIAMRIHQDIRPDLPIQIFTSGRPFVSTQSGPEGVAETKANLNAYFSNYDYISIQMSADEYHLEAFRRLYHIESEDNTLFCQMIRNFMAACLELKAEHTAFLGPMLKLHCGEERLEAHRAMYAWFPAEWWQKYVLLTEGLVNAGNARSLEHTFQLQPSEQLSYFLLPGVDFYPIPWTKRAVPFDNKSGQVYLDDATDSAVIIEGWWNLIDRKAEAITLRL